MDPALIPGIRKSGRDIQANPLKGSDWEISSTKRTVWVPAENGNSMMTQKTTQLLRWDTMGSETVHSLAPNNQCALAWQHEMSFWGSAHKTHAVNNNNFTSSSQVLSQVNKEQRVRGFIFDRLVEIILRVHILGRQSFTEPLRLTRAGVLL